MTWRPQPSIWCRFPWLPWRGKKWSRFFSFPCNMWKKSHEMVCRCSCCLFRSSFETQDKTENTYPPLFKPRVCQVKVKCIYPSFSQASPTLALHLIISWCITVTEWKDRIKPPHPFLAFLDRAAHRSASDQEIISNPMAANASVWFCRASVNGIPSPHGWMSPGMFAVLLSWDLINCSLFDKPSEIQLSN